jgi:hypothetical protein
LHSNFLLKHVTDGERKTKVTGRTGGGEEEEKNKKT